MIYKSNQAKRTERLLAVSVRSQPRESQTLRAFAPVAARTGRTHVHFLCFDLERP